MPNGKCSHSTETLGCLLAKVLQEDVPQFTAKELEESREELAELTFGIIAFKENPRGGWSCQFALLMFSPTDEEMEVLKEKVLDPFRKEGWTVVFVTGDVVDFLVFVNKMAKVESSALSRLAKIEDPSRDESGATVHRSFG